jgi:hypothetical protein
LESSYFPFQHLQLEVLKFIGVSFKRARQVFPLKEPVQLNRDVMPGTRNITINNR